MLTFLRRRKRLIKEMEEETKEVEIETEKISKEFGTNNIIHKEEFSLEGNKKKLDESPNKTENKKETQSTSSTFYPNQQMFYGYNPMMMMPPMNMDPKYQMNNPGICYIPVYFDPSKMPKDMNMNQNMPMFYPMGMYQQNFSEQYNNNKK